MSSEVEIPVHSLQTRLKYILQETWRFFFAILAPIMLLPIFMWKPENKYATAPFGLYITALMAAYWVSECLPLAITSLIPIALVPLFGIASSDVICSVYFNHTIIFLFGGCVVALAFEYSDLHTRISFYVMKSVGAQASILLLGMMLTCMTLSCWMNNTSTTAMMVPVIICIVDQYRVRLIPKETAEELAEKYGNCDPDDIPQFVESKAVIPSSKTRNIFEGGNKASLIEKDDPTSMEKGTKTEIPDETTSGNTTAAASEKNNEESSVRVILSPLEENPPEDSFISAEFVIRDVSFWANLIETKKKYVRNIELMFLIGVAVASNIGGTGVITGSGTNLIASSELRNYQNTKLKNYEADNTNDAHNFTDCFMNNAIEYWNLDFLRWIILNFICMLINVFVSWAFLAVFFQGVPSSFRECWRTTILRKRPDVLAMKRAAENKEASEKIRKAIANKYDDLGRTTFHQWAVFFLFLLLVFLWIFNNPMFFRGKTVKFENPDKLNKEVLTDYHPSCSKNSSNSKLHTSWGWSRFFGDECDGKYMHDYVATVLICFLLMAVPKETRYYKNILRGGFAEGLDDPLLPFAYIEKNTPWGPLFMLGGGFGISKAILESKLNDYLSAQLNGNAFLQELSTNVIMVLSLVGVGITTTIASNTATAVIVSPVLIELARAKGVPPLYLLVPPIVSASYAFCLPISTPPNAIVYDKANMKQLDMLVPGFFLTIICNGILYLMTITWIKYMLNVNAYTGSCNTISPSSENANISIRMLEYDRTAITRSMLLDW